MPFRDNLSGHRPKPKEQKTTRRRLSKTSNLQDQDANATSSPNILPENGTCAGGSCRWLAVPYAEPLAGRFAPSVSLPNFVPPPSTETNGGFGSACIQWGERSASSPLGRLDQSEDCLTLNVWIPQPDENEHGDDADAGSDPSLPVMVWIHGGAFLEGSAADSVSSTKIYDGTSLASQYGVIVVVIQYRLGPFGFLPTSDGQGGANGLGDQISALRWVNRHIHRFGGDPNRVTIFGESSGSVSVCALSHAPPAQGLFQRAILQSGTCYPSLDLLLTSEEARRARDDYLQTLGISFDYLDSAPAEEIVNRTLGAYGRLLGIYLARLGAPSVDGAVLPDLPANLPVHAGLDVLAGVTSADQTVSSVPGGRDQFLAQLGVPEPRRPDVAAAYPAGDDADFFMDACLRCQSQRVPRRAVDFGGSGHYYMYNCPYGTATHGSDVAATFGTFGQNVSAVVETIFGPPPPPGLVRRFQKAWTKFAHTGDPGWDDLSSGVAASFNCGSTEMVVLDEFGQCDLWTAVTDSMGGMAVGDICSNVAIAAYFSQSPEKFSRAMIAMLGLGTCLLYFVVFCFPKRRGYLPIRDAPRN